MRWGLFLVMAAACARSEVDVRVATVSGPFDLPILEPVAADPLPTAPDDVFIELAQGPRALYAAAILPDGRIRYRTPAAQGCRGGVSTERIVAILRIADRVGFWSMKAEYPAVPSGLAPAYRVTINAHGRKKTVLHYASEHSSFVRGEIKNVPDANDRLGLTEIETALEHALHFESVTYVDGTDVVHGGLDAVRMRDRVDDQLAAVRAQCGAFQATALQILVRDDGLVANVDSIPGGAIAGCPEQVLWQMAFEPACNGTNALFTLDGEALHAEVHYLAPDE